MSPMGNADLDADRLKAYSRGVDDGASSSASAKPSSTVTTRSRRHPPSPSEQARRKAWGHKYGGLIAANWKQTLRRIGEA